VAVVVVVVQVMGTHILTLVAVAVLVLIEQTLHLFLDHKQYPFKLVLGEQERLLDQILVTDKLEHHLSLDHQ